MRLSCAAGGDVVEFAGNGDASGAITGEISALFDLELNQLEVREFS